MFAFAMNRIGQNELTGLFDERVISPDVQVAVWRWRIKAKLDLIRVWQRRTNGGAAGSL